MKNVIRKKHEVKREMERDEMEMVMQNMKWKCYKEETWG